jgi:Fe2+ transport system protein FeoA
MGQAMRRGRPRKENVIRDRTGKSRGEVIDFTLIFNQPHRRGQENPASPLHGSPLGRLRACDEISHDQFCTGERWAGLVMAYRVLLLAPAHSPQSGEMADRVSTGFYAWDNNAIDHDPEETAKRHQQIREKYDSTFERLSQLGMVYGKRTAFINVLRKVCLEERDPHFSEVGDLRLALNSVAKHLVEDGR